MSWTKADLLQVAEMMRRAGYEEFSWQSLRSYDAYGRVDQLTKADLVDLINNAERSHTIYGFTEVGVEKDDANFRWVVFRPDGRRLLHVEWTSAYEWRDAGLSAPNPTDFYAALECCLSVEPLTAEDRARLEAARPGITRQPLFMVDAALWEAEDTVEEAPPPRPPRRRRRAEQPEPEAEERRTPSLTRKIRL